LACQIGLPKYLLNRADAVICTSRTVEAEVRAAGCTGRVFTVYDPVDVKGYRSPLSREEARSQLDLPPHHHIIASVGHLERNKGHDDALRALSLLVKGSAQVLLLIVGHDPDPAKAVQRELESLAAQLGVQRYLRFMGEACDVATIYRAADVVYSLSKVGEAFGRVPIEAAAAGVPSVVFDKGALSEITVDGVTGAVVRSSDCEMLARATEQLLGSPGQRQQYVKNAVERAERLFSIDAHCGSVLRVYDQILSAGRGSRFCRW
jgi:glycosyltransferase involved in cell wall biosynthesis